MKSEDKAAAITFSTACDWFGIDRAQFVAELQRVTQRLSRTETARGPLVNLTYLFLSRSQKQALVRIQHEQAARRIIEEVPADADELYWFSSIVSAFLARYSDIQLSPFFEFLKKNQESGESHFRNKIETYIQERALQRFPDDSKSDYALNDSMRYVSRMLLVERDDLEKINYYLNHYHPSRVSLMTRFICNIQLLEPSTDIVLRKIKKLRQAISQLNEAKVKYDLEQRTLNLKRLKECELTVFTSLFDLLLYIGEHDPLHEVLKPIMQKIDENFKTLVKDFQDLHRKNMSKSGEIVRLNLLEKQQAQLIETHEQLKERNKELIKQKEKLEKETENFRKQNIDQEAAEFLKQKIVSLEKENTYLMDDYYSFKVKFLNIIPSDSEEEQWLDSAWQEHLREKKSQATEELSLYDQSSLENLDNVQTKEIDEDLYDEPTKINLAEISPTVLKTRNNRLEIRNQKLDEMNQDLRQQHKLMEQRISRLEQLKQDYFQSKDFNFELEKQSLESHCKILLKDKQKNTERLDEIKWKLQKLLEVYEGDKTEIRSLLNEFEQKNRTDKDSVSEVSLDDDDLLMGVSSSTPPQEEDDD